MATKEQIIARREVATERFIRSSKPVLYTPLWKLDSGPSGGQFLSADGIGHVCTVTGALWTPQGRKFDGIDDVIDVGDIVFNPGTGGFTMMAWVKTTDITLPYLISRYSVNPDWRMAIDNGPFTAYIIWRDAGAGICVGDGVKVVNDNNWHLLAAVRDTTAHLGIIYVDGLFDASHADTSVDVTAPAGTSLTIGALKNDGTNSLDGTIGEALIYNRALTPLEVQRIYLATKWRYQ